MFSPIALRKAKIAYNFGLSECNRVNKSKVKYIYSVFFSSGTEGGIKLYLSEIVQLLQETLQSQSWTTKAQAAAAMSTVADKLGSNLGPPHLGNLMSALLIGLQGRTWAGKVR